MNVLGIDHYNLRASRQLLDILRDFYCSIIGLREGPRPHFSSFGYWLYAGDKPILHLTEARPDEIRKVRISTTFDHVALRCENRSEMEKRLRAHKIEFTVDQVPEVGQVQLFLEDPAGNGVELNFSDA